MSYRHSSNQVADRSLLAVTADIVSRGFMPCTPLSRDSVYDLVVDRRGIFETLQIKTLSGYSFGTSNRAAKAEEFVSLHGKQRNRYAYKDFKIHWMVGVRRNPPYTLYYYPLDTYQNYETIDVRRVEPSDFGMCPVISSGTRTIPPVLHPIIPGVSLGDFLD